MKYIYIFSLQIDDAKSYITCTIVHYLIKAYIIIICMAPDKTGYPLNIFLFLHENIHLYDVVGTH